MKHSRRDFCALGATGLTSLVLGSACRHFGGSQVTNGGRLSARPYYSVKTNPADRLIIGADSGNHKQDAILQLPKNGAESALPLLVMLHGATQSADDMFWYLGSTYEETGVAVLAPNASDTTWDAIGGSFGPDVDQLNRVLEAAFKLAWIDPARVAIGGFSDGATYALSLGLINGDLFSSIVAFSPGFVISGDAHGKPRIYISHGTHDHILPIDRCGRRVAAGLQSRGYDVTFREFDGAHEIPADIAREGLKYVTS
jgi:phospholipase/carboxylesterase